MSRTTALPLQAWPYGSVGAAMPSVLPSAGWGAWVEVVAVTTGVITLAGVRYNKRATGSAETDIQIGIGAAGSEVGIATVHGSAINTYGQPQVYWLEVPVAGITAGVRVAARIRYYPAVSGNAEGYVSILGHVGTWDDPAHLTTSMTSGTNDATYTAGPTITPSGTAWAWSAWTELHAGYADPSGIFALSWVWSAATNPTHYEVQLGLGAAGSESACACYRDMARDGAFTYVLQTRLPGTVLVPAGTRIAARVRTSTTSLNPFYTVSFTRYEDFNPLTEVWVPVANYVEQEIAGESFPGGAARVLGELWTEALGSPGPVVKARLYNLTDSVSVGESAEIQSDEPADCDFAVTLSSGTKRYRLEVTSEPAGVDLFFSGRGVGP